MKKLILALGFFLLSCPLALAQSEKDPLDLPFSLTVADQTQTLTLKELGVSAKEKTAFNILEAFFTDVGFLRQIFHKERYEFSWISTRSEELVRDTFDLPRPKNARFTLTNNVLSIDEEREGQNFDIDAALAEITNDYPRLGSYEIDLTEPDLIEADEIIGYFGQVQALITPGLTITESNQTYHFPAQFKDIALKQEAAKVSLSLNEPYLNYVTSTLESLINVEAQNITILEVDLSDLTKASKTVTEGHVVNGKKVLADATKTEIDKTITNGGAELAATTEETQGQIINETGEDLGPLEYLGTGASNFKTSPAGREANVKKGLNEKMNGILVPKDAEFSLNSFLGPVTNSAGWKNALTIFNGKDLRSVPGGGLCQVATTMYRGALSAGMEITKRKPHSLYVHYYVDGGDGLDATIFPGVQDMKFINNSPNFIFIEAYTDGYDAYVKFYGESDGRTVTFDGPYSQSNQTDEVIAAVGSLAYNALAWKQVITWPDGTEKVNWIYSSYRGRVTQY